MIDWDQAAAFTYAATSAVFDTVQARIKPRSAGLDVNSRPVADTTRAEFDFLCKFDIGPSQDVVARHRPADPAINTPAVSYDAVLTAMVDGWPYLPDRGDHVLVSGVSWEIKAAEDDGSPRRAYYMNRVKD